MQSWVVSGGAPGDGWLRGVRSSESKCQIGVLEKAPPSPIPLFFSHLRSSALIHVFIRLRVVLTARTSCTEHRLNTILTRTECRWVHRSSWFVSWTKGSAS